MELYIAFAFLMIVFALAALFQIQIRDVEELIKTAQRPKTLKNMANKKESRFKRFISNTMSMMSETGQSGKFYFLIAASLLLMVAGVSIGIALSNYFLSPVLAVGLSSVPFIYIRFQYIQYNKLVIEELEVTLSTISLSYERTENILSAIEENLDNIQPPIKKVFADFVYTIQFVNPNMDYAIEEMKHKIDHSVFKEWCDALKRCNKNRSLKYTLRPIVGKLKKIKKAALEQKTILYKAQESFWALIIASIVLLFVFLRILPPSFHVTLPAALTNILVAGNALMVVIAAVRVAFVSRDIKFDI